MIMRFSMPAITHHLAYFCTSHIICLVFQPCPSGFASKYCQSHRGCFYVATYMAEIVINPPPPTPNPSKWPTRNVRRVTVDLSILVFCYFNVLMSCVGLLVLCRFSWHLSYSQGQIRPNSQLRGRSAAVAEWIAEQFSATTTVGSD